MKLTAHTKVIFAILLTITFITMLILIEVASLVGGSGGIEIGVFTLYVGSMTTIAKIPTIPNEVKTKIRKKPNDKSTTDKKN